MNRSDFKTPIDLTWQFTRYGERWNRDSYFDPVRKLYQQRGKLPMFVEDFFKRVATEVPRNFELLEKAAQCYERAGFHERALEIYDRIIRISPFQRSAVLAKANLLVSLKRGEEAVALLRDPKGIASLDDELNGKYQLIRALFKLGRKGEAEKEIADLLAWAKGLPTLQTVADICLGQKEYRKAGGFFEQARALQRGRGDGPMVVGLGKCYARLDRGEEASKVWSELANSGDADGQLDGVQDWLMAEGLYELAAKLGEQRIARRPDNVNLYLGLAETRQRAGDTSAAFQAFKRAATNVGKDEMDELRGKLAGFLMEHGLIAEALKHRETDDNRALTGALAQVLAESAENQERAQQIAQRASEFNVEEPSLQIQLGDALARLNQRANAVVWYRKALHSTNQNLRAAAARGLALAGAGQEALPLLNELMRTRPHHFLSDSNLIVAVARTGDASAAQQLTKVLADSALHDSEKEYDVALVAHYSGKTNETRGKLAALAEAPGLSSAQLQRLAALCDEQKLFAERVKILNRIASGGYGEWTRWGALAELVNTHVKSAPGWKTTDPKRVLGIVRFDRVLGLSQSETLNQVAYARTTIHSPEERRVIFSLGSDDWVKVWVNRELVHASSDARPCSLDQDRFAVTLQKGANRILIKVGNFTDAWGFCLRTVEGGKGLTLAKE